MSRVVPAQSLTMSLALAEGLPSRLQSLLFRYIHLQMLITSPKSAESYAVAVVCDVLAHKIHVAIVTIRSSPPIWKGTSPSTSRCM